MIDLTRIAFSRLNEKVSRYVIATLLFFSSSLLTHLNGSHPFCCFLSRSSLFSLQTEVKLPPSWKDFLLSCSSHFEGKRKCRAILCHTSVWPNFAPDRFHTHTAFLNAWASPFNESSGWKPNRTPLSCVAISCLKKANGKATHRICSVRILYSHARVMQQDTYYFCVFLLSRLFLFYCLRDRVFQPGDRHSWVFLVDKAPGARDRFVSRIFSSCRLYFWASITSEVKARNTKTQLPPDWIPCGIFFSPL